MNTTNKILIVQDDYTLLLPTNHLEFSKIRDEVIKFSEIFQSPDALYIFKITDLSVWNAAAIGISKEYIFETLKKYSSCDISSNVLKSINVWYDSYGCIKLLNLDKDNLILSIADEQLENKINNTKTIQGILKEGLTVNKINRGEIKSRLMKLGYPVEDKAGLDDGEFINIELNKDSSIETRQYQVEAAKALFEGCNGTAVLPCGSGKTVVGIRVMALSKRHTLIITNNRSSTKQWQKSILKMTNLTKDQVSVYDSNNKIFAPITITTYSMIAYKKDGEFTHFNEFKNKPWGQLILDEVHLAPANTFRVVSSFQSIRKTSLTASLTREDGREKDVFTLIGVKRYEKPWKDLEQQGYIAELDLNEVKVPMCEEDQIKYAQAVAMDDKFKIAAMSRNKIKVVKALLEKHSSEPILIIGQFTEQLLALGKELNVPVVYGKTLDKIREEIYESIRTGERKVFVASVVANAAIDIPNLSVLIQVSFQYASRSEETQRQGRITRPNKKVGTSYTLVSENTVEENYNKKRMSFLTNEGYSYKVKRIPV